MAGSSDQRSAGHHALLVADRAQGGACLLEAIVGVLALEAEATEVAPTKSTSLRAALRAHMTLENAAYAPGSHGLPHERDAIRSAAR